MIVGMRKTSGLFAPLCVIVILSILTSLSFLQSSEMISIILVMTLVMVIIATIVAYYIFIWKDPTMLRSEVHVSQMRALDLFGDKDNPLHAEADDVVHLITNPSLPALPAPGNHHE